MSCTNHPVPDCRPGGVYTGTPDLYRRYCQPEPVPCMVPVGEPVINPPRPGPKPPPPAPKPPPVWVRPDPSPQPLPTAINPGPNYRTPPAPPAYGPVTSEPVVPEPPVGLEVGEDGTIPFGELAFQRGVRVFDRRLTTGRGPVVRPCTKARCSTMPQDWLAAVRDMLLSLA